jgi:outer membrane protein assembly factor BamD
MKKYFKVFTLSMVILGASLMVSSCAKVTQKEKEQRAIKGYIKGSEAFTNGDYSSAEENLKRALKYLENLTPEQIERARFMLAKSYYLDHDYTNAIIYLESFLYYYPNSPEAPQATYMLIKSYYKIAPDAYRDQTYTYKAIDLAKEFLSKYPNNPYDSDVRALIDKARQKIAKHDELIAKFYEDYGFYYPAAERYKDMLINDTQYISKTKTYYRLIKNLLLVPKQAKRYEDKYKDMLKKDEDKLRHAKAQDKPFI